MKRTLMLLALLAGVANAETTAIVGGTVHTMGPQGTIEDATVVVSNGRITAVGANASAPDGATIIDASGKIVTPGLFAPASYLGLVEVGSSAGPFDAVQRGEKFTASFDVSDAYNPRSTLIAVNRVEGVTRSLILPLAVPPDSSGYTSHVISGLAAVVNLGGGADSVDRSAAAMVVNLGEAGTPYAGTSRVSALLVLREALDEARDYADHGDSWERGQHRDYALSLADLQALQGVLSREIPLLVFVERASDIAVVIELSREYGVRTVIAGASEAWMVANELASAGIAAVLSPARNLPQSFDHLNARSDNAALLARAGVRIAIMAAEDFTHNARIITQVAGNASVDGLPWKDALRAITLGPAEIFGVADRVGSIELGKEADLVVWPADPLELTTYPDVVMIKGERMSMETRQTLLRDRYLRGNTGKPPAWRN